MKLKKLLKIIWQRLKRKSLLMMKLFLVLKSIPQYSIVIYLLSKHVITCFYALINREANGRVAGEETCVI